jgi:hypothetical protein
MNSKDSIYKKQKQMMKRLSKASLTNIIKGNDFKNVVIGGSKKYTDSCFGVKKPFFVNLLTFSHFF